MIKLFGFGAGAFVIIILIWFGFIQTKGNHLAPSGWISNVRVQELNPDLTLVVIDFGLLNDSEQQMVAGTIDPWITTQGGNNIHGTLFSGTDMAKTFTFYPKLGDQVNPPLTLRGTIDGHKTVNRMIGVEFDVPAKIILARRSLSLKITDITGPEVELTAE